MFRFKSYLTAFGLSAFGLLAPFEQAEAGTLGFATIDLFADLTAERDAVGAISGSGSVTVDYAFSLPVGPAEYSGSVFGGISYETFDTAGVSSGTGDMPIVFPLLPETLSLGAATGSAEFVDLVGLLLGVPPMGALEDLGIFGTVTGTYDFVPDPGSTVSLLSDPIAGMGGFTLGFTFADALGGDLETLVADVTTEPGALLASLAATIEISAAPVPLPHSALLLPLGLLGFACVRRRARKAA